MERKHLTECVHFGMPYAIVQVEDDQLGNGHVVFCLSPMKPAAAPPGLIGGPPGRKLIDIDKLISGYEPDIVVAPPL